MRESGIAKPNFYRNQVAYDSRVDSIILYNLGINSDGFCWLGDLQTNL